MRFHELDELVPEKFVPFNMGFYISLKKVATVGHSIFTGGLSDLPSGGDSIDVHVITSQSRFDVGRRGLDGSEPDGHIRSNVHEKLTASPDAALDVVALDSLDNFRLGIL